MILLRWAIGLLQPAAGSASSGCVRCLCMACGGERSGDSWGEAREIEKEACWAKLILTGEVARDGKDLRTRRALSG